MTSSSNLRALVQPMGGSPCTQVLVTLKLRDGVDLALAMAQMREEMIATAHLYLNGKIQQWFSQLDERGVVFLFNTTDVDETRSLMADLPFVRADMVDLHFSRLGPLLPMKTLLASQDLEQHARPPLK